MSNLTLDQMIDRRPADGPRQVPHPQLRIAAGGREYEFSEIDLYGNAELQAVIKEIVPHPVRAIAPHLEGLPDRDRDRLLDRAYRDAMHWPPEIGSPEGSDALSNSNAGRIAVLWEGLKACDPGATREDAVRLHEDLRKESSREMAAATRAGELYEGNKKLRDIFRCIFGAEPDDGPKASGPGSPAGRANGPSSSGPASNGSA
jgi:hypothetical protein